MMIANVSRPKCKIIAIICLIAFWAGACSTIPEQALAQTIEVVATDLPEISTATVAVVEV